MLFIPKLYNFCKNKIYCKFKPISINIIERPGSRLFCEKNENKSEKDDLIRLNIINNTDKYLKLVKTEVFIYKTSDKEHENEDIRIRYIEPFKNEWVDIDCNYYPNIKYEAEIMFHLNDKKYMKSKFFKSSNVLEKDTEEILEITGLSRQ